MTVIAPCLVPLALGLRPSFGFAVLIPSSARISEATGGATWSCAPVGCLTMLTPRMASIRP